MEFILKEPARVDCFAAMTGTGRVAALQDEVGDEAVEGRVCVVVVEAELQEVAGGERRLGGPELDVEVAVAGVQDYFGTGRSGWVSR